MRSPRRVCTSLSTCFGVRCGDCNEPPTDALSVLATCTVAARTTAGRMTRPRVDPALHLSSLLQMMYVRDSVTHYPWNLKKDVGALHAREFAVGASQRLPAGPDLVLSRCFALRLSNPAFFRGKPHCTGRWSARYNYSDACSRAYLAWMVRAPCATLPC
jgi:hypothetical protein